MAYDEDKKRQLREQWHANKHKWPSASREHQAERERKRQRNRWSVYVAWRKANPIIAKMYSKLQDATRNAKKRATQVGPVDLKAILMAANGLCGICRQPLNDDISFDHIVPLARGGSHTQENLQAAHLVCNSRKGARVLMQ